MRAVVIDFTQFRTLWGDCGGLIMSKGPWSGDRNFCPKGHDKRIVGAYRDGKICAACNKARMTRWLSKNRAAYNERRRVAFAALPKAVRKENKGWDSEQSREKNLRRAYGIGVKDYDRMFTAQAGLCAACHRPETIQRDGKPRRLCVDHNHSTTVVRALHCHNCNRAVGLLGDSAQRALALAEYLQRHAGTELQEVG